MSANSWPKVAPILQQSGYVLPSFATAACLFTANDTLMSAGRQDRQFPLASVTKLLTTWACLIAVSHARLSLDEPVALPAPSPISLRHLLSHASGAPMESGTGFSAPQRRRNYSNYGIECAAKIAADRLGTDFSEWVRTHILVPLEMTDTVMAGSPAHGAVSTCADLQKFAREILNPTLIPGELASEAFAPQYPNLDGIVPGYGRFTPCLWGLGFEIRGDKEHWMPANSSTHTVGHFGQAGSYLWVDHSRGLGAVFLGEMPFGQWHKENWGCLNTTIVTIADNRS